MSTDTDAGQDWPQVWVPVAVFAHLFAGFFLARAFALGRFFSWSQAAACCRTARTKTLSSDVSETKPSSRALLGSSIAEPVVQPARLEWFEVGCTYTTSAGPRIVLQGVFGSTGPGDLLALLGPSGSGKTTLLDILALRKTVGDVHGRMLLNGDPYKRSTSMHHVAYVPQEEVFPPSLSCEEVMQYWSNLALPASMPRQQRQQRTIAVLTALGLQEQTKTLVGGALAGGLMLRGLSGGERKRLAVATGLLNSPSLIFLDEPTTGLDSHSALNVMQHLAAMAGAGHTIVASIHQPRAAVWSLFTHVVVVSQGLMIFWGPRQDLIPWVTQTLGYGPYCPNLHGMAADWIMDLVNVDFQKPKRYYGQTMLTGKDLALAASRFLTHHMTKGTLEAVGEAAPGTSVGTSPHPSSSAVDAQDPESRASSLEGGCLGRLHSKFKPVQLVEQAEARTASWLLQVRTLAWRELLLVTRNPADVAGHSLIFCWVGLFVGLVFFAQANTILSIIPITRAVFVETTAFNLLPFIYLSLHSADKRFFIADAAAGLYHPSAYYAAKVLVSLPFEVLTILTLAFITYGMVGLSLDSGNAEWGPPMLEHMVIVILGYLVASQFLRFSALIAQSQDAGFMVAIAWTAINLLLSNTLIQFDKMTVQWISQLRYLSAMWYTVGGLVRAQYMGQEVNCTSGLTTAVVAVHLAPQLLPNLPILKQSYVQNLVLHPGDGCTIPGDVIVSFGQAFIPSWLVCTALTVYLVVVHGLTYFALLVTQHRERK